MPRTPIVGMVALLVVGGIVLDARQPAVSARAAADAGVVASGPAVAPAGAASVAWYCAEGTANAQGRADETVIVGNPGGRSLRAVVTVMSEGDVVGARRVVVAPRSQARVAVASLGAVAEPGVLVETFHGAAVVEHELRGATDTSVGPCSRQASRHWYFAGGTTVRGAAEYLALYNPFGDDAIVDVSFLTDGGEVRPQAMHALVVPRRSRVSVAVHDQVPRQALVATQVRTRIGRVVAERSLVLDGTDGRRGLAVSLGELRPAPSWVIPVGGDRAAASDGLAVANFSNRPAHVVVDAQLEGSASVAPQQVQVPARGVATIDLTQVVGTGSAYALGVRSERPGAVVAELTSAWTGSAPGLTMRAGAVDPARRWVFAAGASPGFVLAVNTSPRAVTVELLSSAGGGGAPSSAPALAVAPGQLGRFDLSAVAMGSDQVIDLRANGPVVAARVGFESGSSQSLGIPDRG